MTTMRALVRLERDGSLPEDDVVNVWHFNDATVAAGGDVNIVDLLTNFYNSIEAYLSQLLTGNGEIKVYDLADAEPRTPLNVQSFTFTPGAAASFPAEVAICLSYQAEGESGQPQARRRGRIFLGPVGNTAVGAQVGGDMTILGAARTDIGDAAATLAVGPASPGLAQWCVYSRKTDETESLADSSFAVDNGWVDDRFDTQRRRGGSPTARTTWSR